MSNLLPQASMVETKPLDSPHPVFFEDAFESDGFSIYELLNLSSMRTKDGIEDRMNYRNELVRLLETNLKAVAPMTFRWDINSKEFESTSMLFELYLTSLALGEELLRTGTHYKDAGAMFRHCKDILKVWKTTELIYPSCPHVCTNEYLNNMVLLTKGSHLLKTMRSGPRRDMVLASAMKFCGQVSFHLKDWSEKALNHYLIARALLYHDISQTGKDQLEQGEKANLSLTAAKEALQVCNLIDRSKCDMDEALDAELNDVLSETENLVSSLQQVFFAVDVPLENIKLPASLKNDS